MDYANISFSYLTFSTSNSFFSKSNKSQFIWWKSIIKLDVLFLFSFVVPISVKSSPWQIRSFSRSGARHFNLKSTQIHIVNQCRHNRYLSKQKLFSPTDHSNVHRIEKFNVTPAEKIDYRQQTILILRSTLLLNTTTTLINRCLQRQFYNSLNEFISLQKFSFNQHKNQINFNNSTFSSNEKNHLVLFARPNSTLSTSPNTHPKPLTIFNITIQPNNFPPHRQLPFTALKTFHQQFPLFNQNFSNQEKYSLNFNKSS